MIVIGLVGGIASGKSLVAHHFQSLGAELISADQIGHEVLKLPEVKQELCEMWGDPIFDTEGEISRSAVARIVFLDTAANEQLERLEQITHPRIGSLIKQEIERLGNEGAVAIVLDAPVMMKSGWDKMCDTIVFVEASSEKRKQRVIDRGWNVEQWQNREEAQTPLSKKRARADFVVENSEEKGETLRQVQQLWQRWNLPVSGPAIRQQPTDANDQ